jgi:bifunctional DNase/RNase
VSYEKCNVPDCGKEVTVRVDNVLNRRITGHSLYCEVHVEDFLAGYYAATQLGVGQRCSHSEGVGFDIELLLSGYRPNDLCQFSLREIEGNRRLDCRTGIFEVSALRWQLEHVREPRPLTHRALASVIKALNGRLDCVVIDKFLSKQTISYEAKLHIKQMNITAVVDVRPSDAVVLAVICNVPIIVSNSVLTALAEEK